MRRIAFLISFILYTIFYSCNKDNCSTKLGFTLSYNLFDDIDVNGDTYCDLVSKSLNDNEKSITELCKLKFNDGASYEHGAAIIEVINKISEKKFTAIFRKLDNEEKKYLYNSILFAGLEFTNNLNYKGKHISKAFPLLTREFEKI
jgi:hypothetical protein